MTAAKAKSATRQRVDPNRNGRADDRLPPHDLPTEESAVGACLLSAAACKAVLELVSAADFYSPALAHIVDAMTRLFERGHGIDVVTVGDELRRAELLDTVGGLPYLNKLQIATPAISNAAQYATSVLEASHRRALLTASAELADIAYHETHNLSTGVARIRERLDELATDAVDEDLTSFTPRDLGPAWRGEKTKPTAEVFLRDDDVALLVPGINYMFGDSGDGKSMVALMATACELRAGHPVIWVSYEDTNEDLTIERLQLLGATDHDIGDNASRLQFITPQTDLNYGAKLIADLALSTGARLLVLDSVGEAMAVGGINEDRDNEVGPWIRRTLRLIHDQAPALTILPIDHSTKSKDNPLFPSGSKRKRAAITGRMYLLDAGGKGFGVGVVGYVRLVVAKDRGGIFKRGDIAADIRLDATQVPYQWTITAPSDGDTYAPKARRRNSEERVLAVLAGSSVELNCGDVHRLVNTHRNPGESEISMKTCANKLTELAKRPGVVVTGGQKDSTGKYVSTKWRLEETP